MDKWKSDLDALINDTMVMVAATQGAGSVYRPAVVQPPSTLEQSVAPAMPSSATTVQQTGPSADSERDEIRRRVATFKAYQERWIRERENYANSILKGIDRRAKA
jgi:hypothetical protein